MKKIYLLLGNAILTFVFVYSNRSSTIKKDIAFFLHNIKAKSQANYKMSCVAHNYLIDLFNAHEN